MVRVVLLGAVYLDRRRVAFDRCRRVSPTTCAVGDTVMNGSNRGRFLHRALPSRFFPLKLTSLQPRSSNMMKTILGG